MTSLDIIDKSDRIIGFLFLDLVKPSFSIGREIYSETRLEDSPARIARIASFDPKHLRQFLFYVG